MKGSPGSGVAISQRRFAKRERRGGGRSRSRAVADASRLRHAQPTPRPDQQRAASGGATDPEIMDVDRFANARRAPVRLGFGRRFALAMGVVALIVLWPCAALDADRTHGARRAAAPAGHGRCSPPSRWPSRSTWRRRWPRWRWAVLMWRARAAPSTASPAGCG
jgi:hypothetical protein